MGSTGRRRHRGRGGGCGRGGFADRGFRSWGGFGTWGGFCAATSSRAGRRDPSFRPRWLGEDELRLALLSLLERGSRTGHELILEVEERSGGAYSADARLVYPLLQMLVDQELLAVTPRDSGNVYELTPAGRTAVDRERDRIERLWRRADRTRSWEGGWTRGCAGRVHDERDAGLQGAMTGVDEAMAQAARACESAFEAIESALDDLGLDAWCGCGRRSGRRSHRRRRHAERSRREADPSRRGADPSTGSPHGSPDPTEEGSAGGPSPSEGPEG